MGEVGSDVDEPERLLTGPSGRLFVGLALGGTAAALGSKVIPPLLPVIIESIHISPSQAGAALTMMTGFRALVYYPSGRLSDGLSRKTVLVAGISVLIVGFIVMTAVTTYPLFLLGMGLVGIGGGIYSMSSRAWLSDLFVERRGQAFGLLSAAGTSGSIVAAGLAVAALSLATWRAAFLPAIVLLAGFMVLVQWTSHQPYVISRVNLGVRSTMGRILGPHTGRLLIAFALTGFCWLGVVNFLPVFLQSDKGFSATIASLSYASIYFTGLLVAPGAGRLGDRWGHPVVAAGGLLISTAGLITMLVASATSVVLGGVILFSTGVWGYTPSIQAHLMRLLPQDNLGGDFGAFNTVFTIVASVGPMYVGFAAERSSYTVAFLGFVICLPTAAGFILWQARRECADRST